MLSLILLLSLGPPVLAQSYKVDAAALAARSGDTDGLSEAATKIEAATRHKETGDQARTWAVQGELLLVSMAAESSLSKSALDAARSAYQRAKQLGPLPQEEALGLQRQALTLLQRGASAQADEALLAARTVFQLCTLFDSDPCGAELRALAGQQVVLAGRAAQLPPLAAAQELLDMMSKTPMGPQTVALAAMSIDPSADKGAPALTLKLLRKGLEQHPGDPALLDTLVNALLVQGDAAGALPVAEQLIEVLPGHPVAWLSYSRVLEDLDRVQDSREALGKALALDGGVAALFSQAASHINEARQLLTQMNSLDSDDPRYDVLKAQIDQSFRAALPLFEQLEAKAVESGDAGMRRESVRQLLTITLTLGLDEQAAHWMQVKKSLQ